MKRKNSSSLFGRIMGTVNPHEDEYDTEFLEEEQPREEERTMQVWNTDDTEEEGELTIDMYQTDDEVIINSMIAGVDPADLDVSISRDEVIIKGSREDDSGILEDDGFIYRELYWGSFSRTIPLTVEIDPDRADATERNGLLTITLPKIDRSKASRVKVKGN
ncbi:MAG: Hsp20/alpha crystallin family protein [Candidatus Yonathbacteria bacterium]|nr:Hsp20/alpha crystallin family protein [Candidatus Yonathbacteria bacterium]